VEREETSVENKVSQPSGAPAIPMNRLGHRIHALPGDDYELLEPLDIILGYYPEEVVASLPELGIFGEGTSEKEALDQLKLELLDLADIVYELPESGLGPEPRQWRKILDRVLRRCP